MEVCGQLSAPTALTLGRKLDTHRPEGWLGLRAGSDVLEKRKASAPTGITVFCAHRYCIYPIIYRLPMYLP
jgi:plasmid maintenance system antidote protein VapI